MGELQKWMRLVEGFIDHLADAVEASQTGFYFEEGGCWGMALALYDAFQAAGEHPKLMLQTNAAHALVQVNGALYDYSGDVSVHNVPVRQTTVAGLMRAAIAAGHSADDVRADKEAAAEIIESAINR